MLFNLNKVNHDYLVAALRQQPPSLSIVWIPVYAVQSAGAENYLVNMYYCPTDSQTAVF